MKKLLVTSGILITVAAVAGLVGYNSTKVEDLQTYNYASEVKQIEEKQDVKEIVVEDNPAVNTEAVVPPVVEEQFTIQTAIGYAQSIAKGNFQDSEIVLPIILNKDDFTKENYKGLVETYAEYIESIKDTFPKPNAQQRAKALKL